MKSVLVPAWVFAAAVLAIAVSQVLHTWIVSDPAPESPQVHVRASDVAVSAPPVNVAPPNVEVNVPPVLPAEPEPQVYPLVVGTHTYLILLHKTKRLFKPGEPGYMLTAYEFLRDNENNHGLMPVASRWIESERGLAYLSKYKLPRRYEADQIEEEIEETLRKLAESKTPDAKDD